MVQEYEQNPMVNDSDNTQEIRQAEHRAIKKRKLKAPASFTKSSSSTISKALSFQLLVQELGVYFDSVRGNF